MTDDNRPPSYTPYPDKGDADCGESSPQSVDNAPAPGEPVAGMPATPTFGDIPNFSAGEEENYQYIGVMPKNALAPWALGVGIVSIVVSLFNLGLVVGLVGLILSIIAFKKAKKYVPANQRKGIAIGGIATSIVGIVIGLIILALTLVMYNKVVELQEICGTDTSDPGYIQCIEDNA